MTEIVGAVLVGGASSRMGTDKALITLDGQAMGRRVAAALVAGGATAIDVIGDDPEVGHRLDLTGVIDGWSSRSDLWSGIGPLGGIATAVVESRPPRQAPEGELPRSLQAAIEVAAQDDVIVVIAACDQPDLDGALIGRLVGALLGAGPDVLTAAVRTADGRRHPFPSAWRAAAGPALHALIDAGARRADAGFSIGPTVEVEADPAPLIDLDTPADLARWRQEQPKDPEIGHGSP